METSIPPVLNSATSDADSVRLAPPATVPPPQMVRDSFDASVPFTRRGRFLRRSLSMVAILGVLGGLFWATSPRARLSKPTEDISSYVPESVQTTASRIDATMLTEIERQELAVAPPADWLTIARRISLALVGNGLSLEEIRVVEQLPESERIAWWTEYLLEDRRSADYLAERWTRATVGTNNGPFLVFRRRMYVEWLADQFQKNTPFDRVVREILASKGSWTDSPEVNFLTATLDESDKGRPDAIRLAGRTSRAFLAQRIDCLQCHQDYLGKVNFSDEIAGTVPTNQADPLSRTGEQADFHQLAAFFSSAKMDNPFVGIKNSNVDYKIKYLNADEESDVAPTVPYRRDLLPETGETRERLAAWITHPENKAFARATVNRTWALLFGKPLVEPIDSIPLSGPFPAGLEILAEQFITSGFNMKQLIKTIVCTEAFQRDSRIPESYESKTSSGSELSELEVEEKHELAWAVFPLTQLRPEQVAASIHQSARIKAIDGNSSIIAKLELFGGVNDFTKAYGDRGDEEFTPQTVTIPQRLLVMNGSYVSEHVDNNPIANASSRIAMLAGDDKLAIETAYLSVLNRKPSGAELTAFCDRLHDTRGDARSKAVGSLFWTLINSTEFQWNH